MTDPKTDDPRWTLTLTDATGQTTTLDSRAPLADIRRLLSGSTLDQTSCLIIDDPAPTSSPPTASTWSQPMRASQRASAERRPGAMWAANQKRWRRGLRNLRNQQREREGRIRQEVRAELHDLTRPGGGK